MAPFFAAILTALVAWTAFAAEPPGADEVADYEARLEAIGAEVDRIRAEIEALVAEVAAAETGQVFVFVEGLPEPWVRSALRLSVDGRPVFARPLEPPEREVLAKGLPLELVELRLSAGAHEVVLEGPDGVPSEPAVLEVPGAGVAAWVATPAEQGVEWRVE